MSIIWKIPIKVLQAFIFQWDLYQDHVLSQIESIHHGPEFWMNFGKFSILYDLENSMTEFEITTL